MQDTQRRSRSCAFRNIPKPFLFTVMAIPTAITVSASGIPAAAAHPVRSTSLAGPVAAPSAPAASPLSARGSKAWLKAYFRAGYNYNDAALMSRLWSNSTTPYSAKLRAGSMLVSGDTVPVRPNQNVWRVSDDTAREAFYSNGYGYRDAVTLARAWKRPRDVAGAKTKAGRLVLAGRPLPGVAASQAPSARLKAFFRAGYNYNDAVVLSRLWGFESTPYNAKLRAGEKLLAREAMPLRPRQNVWRTSDETALEAFFNNGYDYKDAEKLAGLWSDDDTSGVKATAGRKLLAGLRLPVR